MRQLRYWYRKMENQKLGPGLACNRNLDFAKRKMLKPTVKKFSTIVKLEDVVSKLV